MKRYLAFKGQTPSPLLNALVLTVLRYFPETVRDDYAAGQLDAQVCRFFLSYFIVSINISLFQGGRRVARNEGVIDMRSYLISTGYHKFVIYSCAQKRLSRCIGPMYFFNIML
jgi:hypothetical protein